jgi:hypothetical protein
MTMTIETTMTATGLDAAVHDAMVRDLVNGLVHALPAIALGTRSFPDARSRAEEFALAFAARRAA